MVQRRERVEGLEVADGQHHAKIVAPEIDSTTGTERTRAAALRHAQEEAFHAAARAAAWEFLGMDP